MRLLFGALFTIFMVINPSVTGFGQNPTDDKTDSFKERLALYKGMYARGELNETEYRQLTEEMLNAKYNLAGMNSLLKKQNKAMAHITSGAILFPVGVGMFAVGLSKFRQPVQAGSEADFEYRERLNKRYGIGIMTSGWLVSIAGATLVGRGIHLRKIMIRSKKENLSLNLGINRSGDFGMALKF